MQLNRGIPRIGAINRSHPHASGLVSCWRVMPDMERGTKWYDLAGRSDGALSGPIWRGDGLRFDGDDYATISNSNVLNFGTGAFAISAWVKADNPSSNADGIFSKDSFAGGSSYTGFLLNVGDSNKWAFETRNVVSGSGPRAQVVSVANAGTDRTHLVGVRDGISPAPLRLYVNGVLVNSETEAAEANISNNTTATIGALNADFLGQYFNGVIEAVSAYNRALSATEVSQLYRDPLGMFNRVRVPVGPKRTPVTPRGSALTLNRGIPRIGAINRSHPHARGLVSCWRAMPDMERGTRWRDLAGKNDGTLVNGPTWRADGLRFDGSDDYVTASDAGLPIGTASRTMSAWVRVPSTPGADKGVLSYGSAGTNFQASVLYVQGSTGKAGFSNWVDAGALTPGSIADDKWHHLVAMLSAGGEMRVFVDGEFAVLVVQSMNTTSVGSVSIGQFGNGQGGFINAAINDCRIYNRALSAAEIKSLYTDPPGMFNRVRVPVTVKRTPVTPRGSALTLNRGIPRVGAINRSHPLATGLAAFWYGIPGRNGGSQLYDLAGKYNGALSGDARWQGNRLAFDGNDDYVNFGDVLNVGLSDFTVRVVAATTGSDFSLLAKSRAAQATGRWYLLYTGGAMLAQITDPSVSALGPTWTTTSILDGAPHCITATFSRSGNATIYSDGVIQMASTIAAFSAVDLTTTYPLLMGKYNNTDGSVSGNILPLNGTISSAAMWMRCLSPTEVMADYRESRAGFPTLLNRVRVPIGPKRTPVTPRGSALTLNRGIPRIGAINRSHPLASGLLACWRALPDMERGTKWRDLAGKNDGTLVNGPVWRADGLSFDGSSHYVSVADSPTLTPAAISVSAWIYVTGGEGTYRGIVTKGNGSNDQSFALQINNSTNRIEFWVSSNGTTIASVFGTTAFTAAAGNLNVWKHVTGTYDGTSYKIYVNGVLEGTDTVVTGALWDSSSAISIGKWAGGFSDYFPGRMNDIRIYNRALSATEVASLYRDPLGMFGRVRVPIGRFAETQAGSGGGGWIFRSRLFRSPIIYGGW